MRITLSRAATICRIILAVTFIFSGFVKTIDPWGTAIKISEYLNAFGFENLKYYRFGFAIWLCGAELMMGCMLLFKVRTPLISIFALGAMIIFTSLTFVVAMWLPVEDCGCFGDAVKLGPWQTFFKNLVLLPMSVVVWLDARRGRIFPILPREWGLTLLFFLFAGGLGIYCYLHLPLIDFLPYKVGTDLRASLYECVEVEHEPVETILVYLDKHTGRTERFTLEDTVWYDASRWEWVETITGSEGAVVEPSLVEFGVQDIEGDATQDIISTPGRVYLICVNDFETLSPSCAERLGRLVSHAHRAGALVVCLTPSPLREVTWRSFAGSEAVRCYNMDATTMVTMLRAKAGMVELTDGVITDKRNCRDIDF